MVVLIGRHSRHTANHSWHLDLGSRRLFVKANPHPAEARAERQGHARIYPWYPVPRLVRAFVVAGWSFHVYERWAGVDRDRGLLLDEITRADNTGDLDRLAIGVDDVLDHYETVITQTVRRTSRRETVGKLYANRAAPAGRLNQYYGGDPRLTVTEHAPPIRISELREIVVNDQSIRVNFDGLLASLRAQFAPDRPVWAAMTQGDPTDFNIGWSSADGPVWFDYDTAGLNSLAGEFACFLMYQRLHGAWLTPTYNPAAYTDHPMALHPSGRREPLVRVRHTDRCLSIEYRHTPSTARQFVISRYLDRLVRPLANLLAVDDLMDWLRPYLVMRLLGVYNICDLNPADTALSLALLTEALPSHTTLEGLLGLTESPAEVG